MRRVGLCVIVAVVAALVGCETKLDRGQFRRRAERAYTEVNPGFMILKREAEHTVFARGDQVERLAVGELFDAYTASGQDGSDFLDAWKAERAAEVAARRRTLTAARTDVIPILKSGKWIEAQDLGAIGPAEMRDRIRPWRKEVAPGLYAVLGVPEEKLGYRFASVREVEESGKDTDWIAVGLANLREKVGEISGAEMEGKDGRLKVLDLKNVDGVSALILDTRFRMEMLERFQMSEIGAAAPIRNVLILFDPSDFTTKKPIRARTYQLYDTQNHPGFRGLLRLDKDGVTVIEGPKPG